MAVDPIHQFAIQNITQIGDTRIHLTNSAIFMAISVGLTLLLLLGTTSARRLVPTRMQSAGEEGMKFFPLVFSLFMFILFANLVGLIPYAFTVTSHIIITAALALLVFFTVIIYGFWTHGLGWLKLFVPHGIPTFMIPLIVVIELLSFFSRPISHSVRLFANMLAGHITLKLVAGFIGMLGGVGLVGWLAAIAPLALTVALTALEFLVAALQAFVFAILTCIYLNDAIHPAH
jgi:F-type H+-transporting ATPase subunit a